MLCVKPIVILMYLMKFIFLKQSDFENVSGGEVIRENVWKKNSKHGKFYNYETVSCILVKSLQNHSEEIFHFKWYIISNSCLVNFLKNEPTGMW